MKKTSYHIQSRRMASHRCVCSYEPISEQRSTRTPQAQKTEPAAHRRRSTYLRVNVYVNCTCTRLRFERTVEVLCLKNYSGKHVVLARVHVFYDTLDNSLVQHMHRNRCQKTMEGWFKSAIVAGKTHYCSSQVYKRGWLQLCHDSFSTFLRKSYEICAFVAHV